MKIVAYIFTIIGTLIGGWTLLETVTFAESAPQQGAGAAMAIAWAVLPYCFARSVEKIGEVTVIEAFKRHWQREEDRADTSPDSPALLPTNQPPAPQTPTRRGTPVFPPHKTHGLST